MMEAGLKADQEAKSGKEEFWKNHAKLQRESGLSTVAYCRKHQINYDQFWYWRRKWRQASPARLLPVNIDRLPKVTPGQDHNVICTLTLKNGQELKVHDQSILPLLLSVLG